MKNLSRTIPGKFIVYLLTVGLIAVVAAGVVVTIIRIDYAEGKYDYKKQVYLEENVEAIAKKTVLDYLRIAKGTTVNPDDLLLYSYTGDLLSDLNFVYELRDFSSDKVLIPKNGSYDDKNGWDYSGMYEVKWENRRIKILPTNGTKLKQEKLQNYPNGIEGGAFVFNAGYIGSAPDYVFSDNVFEEWVIKKTADYPAWNFIFVTVAAFIMFLGCFVILMCSSARRPLWRRRKDGEETATEDGLYPGVLNSIPFDILLLVCALIIVMPMHSSRNYLDNKAELITKVYAAAAWGLLCAGFVIGLCMSAAARIKQGSLISNSVIGMLLMKLWGLIKKAFGLLSELGKKLLQSIKKLPIMPKTACFLVLVWAYALICSFVVIVNWKIPGIRAFGLIMIILGLAVFTVFTVYIVLKLIRLQDAAKALAEGRQDYVVDTEEMPEDLARHGEYLNNIAKGIGRAVEEKLKSERMKTELITNVSHDIKTPLTSIINYSDLIRREKSDNPKIEEYSEVLSRQSDRLKRLIEDLVEASKASTGNLDVELSSCDAELFINQTAGEYEEKFEKRKLKIVTKNNTTDNPHIMADGRRMLRVFDNLMNNIYKYAKADTRVYLTLSEEESGFFGNTAVADSSSNEGGRDENGKEKLPAPNGAGRKYVVFTFKNTSEAELDISAEELMERFVRGDRSRNSEGNGLGLSIAKSLTELQNGSLGLTIDGDLFKAELRFPVV